MNASLMLKSTAAADQAKAEEAMAQEFQASMAELEAFVKARGAAETKTPLDGKDSETEAGKTETGKDAVLKSVTDKKGEDGKEEVVDGEQVIADFKATLTKSIASVQANVQAAQKSTDDAVLILAKSVHALQTVVATLHDQLAMYGNAGRPRKSLLTVVTKSITDTNPEPTLSANDILNKAVSSTLTPSQVSEVRQYLQDGQKVPVHLMREIEKVK